MSSTIASSQVLPTETLTMRPVPRYSKSPTTSDYSSATLKNPTPSLFPDPPLSTQAATPTQKQNAALSVYRSISWMFGFRENWSLLWFFICGGALLGFCLARSMTLNPKLLEANTVPGEFFWFSRPKFKINYSIHIYLSFVGGILVGPQFLPAFRRRAVILHRLNGYFCLICLSIANITGSIVAAKSFGGEINAATAYYILGIVGVASGIIGIFNVKRQTRQHRKWMLRMVTYFCVPITSRLIMVIARAIISDMGSYFSVWRCDEMFYLMTNQTAAQTLYPQCFGVDPSTVSVAVHASLNEDKINVASAVRVTMGMSLWVATLIHGIGVEIYIKQTESMNHNRYGYVLEPKGYDGGGEPLWTYGG